MYEGYFNLTGSTKSLSKALDDYYAAWKAFIVVHHLDLLESLVRPTTLSWKVADKHNLFENLEAIAERTQQVHIGTVNGRFIASAVLAQPISGMHIVKILERRADSSDTLGLDSLDYIVTDMSETYRLLKDSGAHVEKQHNPHHAWLSVLFGKNLEYEAKFTDNLILEVAIKELEIGNTKLRKLIRQ